MKWLFLIIYLFLILLVLFLERKRPTEALLWVLILILLPYVGIILYLIFGSTIAIKLTLNLRKKRLKNYNELNLKEIKLDEDVLSEVDSEVIKFNYEYNKAPVTSYDNYDFYLDGISHYEELFKDIKAAKDHLYVEFYTIHNDVVGHKFIELLTKKAEEGLKVYVLIDFVANISDPAKMFKNFRKAGGKLIRVKPFLTHYRSHRKLVVIDSEISYIGGMNIGKKYANLTKKKNPWRDTQVRLVGDCSKLLDRYFFRDLFLTSRKKDLDEVLKMASMLAPIKKPDKNYCQFILGGVDSLHEGNMKMTYLALIRSAKKEILIESPYFVPDSSILDALKTAIATGVKVKFVIAGVKSSFFLDPVTTYFMGELLELGAEVYKYQGYIHAKTLIIDQEVSVIGSVNMDQRSFTIDDEICGIFYENKFVHDYYEIFKTDVKNSVPYLYEDYLKRGNLEKAKEAFFTLFSSLM